MTATPTDRTPDPGPTRCNADDIESLAALVATMRLMAALGGVAAALGSDPEVRALGRRTMSTHTALAVRATRCQRTWPHPARRGSPTRRVHPEVVALRALAGGELDREFVAGLSRHAHDGLDQAGHEMRAGFDPRGRGVAEAVIRGCCRTLALVQDLSVGRGVLVS